MTRQKQWKGYNLDQLKYHRTLNYLKRQSIKQQIIEARQNSLSLINIAEKGYRLWKEYKSFFASK